jgi:3-oxoacyl-[acyl-carrier-protein] synthase II
VKKRVVITGLGALTALGEGAEALWGALIEGRSGIGPLDLGGHGWEPAGAQISDFIPEKYVTQRKALKVMSRDMQLAVAGAKLAIEDAGLTDVASASRERFGVIVGSGVLNHELDELYYSVSSALDASGKLDLNKFGTDGLSALFPLWLLKYLPNMPACHISVFFDLRGPNNTLTTGASAGLQAAGEAFHIIQRGAADVMLCGGAESKLNPVGLSQYRILGVLADALGDPQGACRPFDPRSRGIVPGEGAGFLVLEEYEHAQKRSAKIYAEVAGFGSSSSTGQEVAMKAALAEAGIPASGLDYLQASALGIPSDDALEAAAIEKVFSSAAPDFCVSATKPTTGFTGFSAGALDLIVSTMGLERQEVPPVFNASASGCRWGFKLVSNFSAKKKVRAAMTNAFGLHGQCVSMVTRVPGDAS